MLSGAAKYAWSSSWKMASRSTMGILVWHFSQTYLGELDFTYIFWPHKQKVRPANSWTAFLPGRFSFFCCSSRIWLHWLQRASETMGLTGITPHSLSGLSSHVQLPVCRVRLR